MNSSYQIGSITLCNESLFSTEFCFLIDELKIFMKTTTKIFSELAHSQEAKAVNV